MPAIGIDLGTTYSCVAVWKHGRVEVIANDMGHRITPSCVAFSGTGRMVGDAAKNQAALNPVNTVFSVKRLIGRKYNDPDIQQDIMQHWPFTVIDDGGKPKVQVIHKGEPKRFAPEEISSMVLAKMKSTAETYLDETVTEAVITVPAYFNDAQRQATIDAGTVAGLNVLRILNEPSAAALAYGLEKNVKGKRNVLIFDLGGGTFDISVLTIDESSQFEVKSTAGDTHLGGDDFDARIVNHLADEFKRKFDKDVGNDARAMRRLRTAAEKAKCVLSSTTKANIEIGSLYEGEDFYTSLSRARFEQLNSDLFRSTLGHVEKALVDAKFNKSDIHDVVLVGGSTRIPKIQRLLEDFFSGKKLNMSINADEAVAYGAAVQAAVLTGADHPRLQDLVLVNVTPLSLGIRIVGGVMDKVIPRNSKIPCCRTNSYETAYVNQTSITFLIYEGERVMTKDNNLLGSFTLTGIPPLPRGEAKFAVTFDIDANGILKVSATEQITGQGKNIVIEIERGRLSKAEIVRMVWDADRYKEDDERQLRRVTVRHKLEAYAYDVRHALNGADGVLSAEDLATARRESDQVLDWLGSNMMAEKEEYERRLEQIERVCSPMMSRL